MIFFPPIIFIWIQEWILVLFPSESFRVHPTQYLRNSTGFSNIYRKWLWSLINIHWKHLGIELQLLVTAISFRCHPSREQGQLQWDLVFTFPINVKSKLDHKKTMFPSPLVHRMLAESPACSQAPGGEVQWTHNTLSMAGLDLNPGRVTVHVSTLTKARAKRSSLLSQVQEGSSLWLDGASLFCKRNFLCWDSLYIFIMTLLKKKNKRKMTVQWWKRLRVFISSLKLDRIIPFCSHGTLLWFLISCC